MLVNGEQQIPFNGMTLNYHVETTNDLKTVTNLEVNGWSNLRFYDVSSSSSKLIVTTSGTLTQNGEVTPLDSNSTIDFPTDQDTLIFLKNGGNSNLAIYDIKTDTWTSIYSDIGSTGNIFMFSALSSARSNSLIVSSACIMTSNLITCQ